MGKVLTTDEYIQRVKDVWGDEYTVLGEFVNSKATMQFRHNKCGWIIDSYPHAFLVKNAKCPICYENSKHMTTESLKRKILEKSGDDYELLSDYHSMTKHVLIKHNNCCCKEGFHIFSTTPKNFLDHTGICPKERHKGVKLTIDVIKDRLIQYHPNYRLLSGEYRNPDDLLSVKCNKGHVYEVKIDGINAGHGCPVCSNKKLLTGVNDYRTTHKKEADYLLDSNDGYDFFYGTKQHKYYKCKECGHIQYRIPSEAFDDNGRFRCECNDGFSYPERLMKAVLDSLGIRFIHQLSKRHYKWCDVYRYDFYLIDYNIIIETHGKQHYEQTQFFGDLNTIQENDKNKQIIAYNNGISDYIVIDARYSDFGYIRNSIVNSDLNKYIDFNLVDWSICNNMASTSMSNLVIDMWNNGVHSIPQISTTLDISDTTVKRYLISGGESGQCDFDIIQHRIDVNHGAKRVPVKCIETQTIYRCFNDVKKQLGINLSKKKIQQNDFICGFHWELA